jgi:ornithine cyclodeaminase
VQGDEKVGGIKWVSSFPDNIHHDLPRASAVVVLNDMENGRAKSIIEASIINYKSTAASAALAAKTIYDAKQAMPQRLVLVGCGPINYEIARFLQVLRFNFERIEVYDLDANRAEQFARQLTNDFGMVHAHVRTDVNDILNDSSSLISFGTTAATPYIDPNAATNKNTVVLNISLRDIPPEIIKTAFNIVDDIDHVSRENTSIYLAEQIYGRDGFEHTAIGAILNNDATIPSDKFVIFSPFGLGILDLQVASMIEKSSREQGFGLTMPNFFG